MRISRKVSSARKAKSSAYRNNSSDSTPTKTGMVMIQINQVLLIKPISEPNKKIAQKLNVAVTPMRANLRLPATN